MSGEITGNRASGHQVKTRAASPGAKPAARKPSPRPPAPRIQYAGFGIRAAAFCLDAVFVALITVAFGFALALIGYVTVGGNAYTVGHTAGRNFTTHIGVISVAYHCYFIAGKWQATLGKRLCGIHVTEADGTPITRARAVGRYLASILSTLSLGIGYLMAAFTDQKKSLHDIISDTRVVYGRK